MNTKHSANQSIDSPAEHLINDAANISSVSCTYEYLKDKDIVQVCDLFNQYAESETVYKKLPLETFTNLFLAPQACIQKINIVAKKTDGSVIGFANGCVKEGKQIG